MPTHRRTSPYSLRVHGTTDLAPLALAVMADRPLTDQHTNTEGPTPYAAVGYRATDDDDARQLAARVTPAGAAWELITGHGIHRRTV